MKFFKIKHSRELSHANWKVKKVNNFWAAHIKSLTDYEIKDRFLQLRKRHSKGESLNSLLIEAFAIAKEGIFRVTGMTLFDVQLSGAVILHSGAVAEMRTGEGKTITSIPVVYLNALSGDSIIVSTVNEYLTQRDGEENGKVYEFLGLSVGINKRELSNVQKRDAYACDVTYSVHSEIGFDYLRDNMVKLKTDKVQRPFSFCLIDEADSILIDEAKTPLIISGGKGSDSKIYMAVDQFCKTLSKKDIKIDAETKGISLSSSGVVKAQKFFGMDNLYAIERSELVHRIQNSLRANHIMVDNIEYIIREGKLILVDAFTGRVMPGRSYSDGLQQAIQAKEGIEVEPETKTLATITYQNLFRLFKKLAGMTGTAKTEEQEFIDIYNVRVVQVPTNKPVIRKDFIDHIYINKKYKIQAIIEEIKARHNAGWSILIGTAAVEDSEELAILLKKEGLKFKILNAKNDELEADIIASAGKYKAITISTNMAGRGTDIKIDKKVVADGKGLFVLATDKAESRRIDNQLRGRSGRQGEPGESQFFISLDDQLISRFSAKDKLKAAFKDYKEKPIISKSMTKAILRAQKKIENMNFDSRKQVLDYDDVIRQQRDVMYAQRNIIIGYADLLSVIKKLLSSVAKDVPTLQPLLNNDRTINYSKLTQTLNNIWFNTTTHKLYESQISSITHHALIELLDKKMFDTYLVLRNGIIEKMGEEFLHNYEREIIINTFDQNWQNHIDAMDKLRSSVSLSSYAQKNPIQIYIQKGHDAFKELTRQISHNIAKILLTDRFGVISVQEEAVHPLNVPAPAADATKALPIIPTQHKVQQIIAPKITAPVKKTAQPKKTLPTQTVKKITKPKKTLPAKTIVASKKSQIVKKTAQPKKTLPAKKKSKIVNKKLSKSIKSKK